MLHMNPPKLIPFRAIHLQGLVNRDTAHQEPWTLAVEKQQSGPAFTGVLGDTILGCAGVVIPWPGVGLAWMVLSEQIGDHAIWMTRMVKHFLNDIRRGYALHRLEAVVLLENERNQRWIEALGFTRENGKAREYTSAREHVIRYELVGEE